jgi:hypothetical protein
MRIRVALNHRTQYRYDKAVFLGPQVIQLRPAPHCRTPILSYSLSVTPAHHLLNWQLDPHHNHLARLLFPDRTNDFVVEVDLVAELSPLNPFDFFLEPGVEDYPFEYAPGLAKDLEPYRSLDPAGSLLQAFLQGISGEKCGTVGFLVDLNRRGRDEIGYVTRLDPGVQTSEQTLEVHQHSLECSGLDKFPNLDAKLILLGIGFDILPADRASSLRRFTSHHASARTLHARGNLVLKLVSGNALDETPILHLVGI